MRYANAGAEIAIALLLIVLAWVCGLGASAPWYVALVWLAHPVGSWVLEHAWVDPVMMMFIALATLCLVKQWWWALGITLGLVAGVKQYGAVVGFFTVVLLLASNRRALVPVLVGGGVTVALLIGPFLALDGQAFYESTIKQVFSVGLREDALSLPRFWGWLAELAGRKIPFPSLLITLIYLCSLAACSYWVYRRGPEHLRHWMAGIAIMFGMLFLWGKLAFCNYYYFESFLVLLYVVLTFRPAQGPTGALE